MRQVPRRRAPISQHEIEERILALCDALEETTADFAEFCDKVPEAEMDYKHQHHTALVALSNGPKITAQLREAKAWLVSEEQERAFRVLLAGKEATKASLSTITTRIDALRTLSANVRNQT